MYMCEYVLLFLINNTSHVAIIIGDNLRNSSHE